MNLIFDFRACQAKQTNKKKNKQIRRFHQEMKRKTNVQRIFMMCVIKNRKIQKGSDLFRNNTFRAPKGTEHQHLVLLLLFESTVCPSWIIRLNHLTRN